MKINELGKRIQRRKKGLFRLLGVTLIVTVILVKTHDNSTDTLSATQIIFEISTMVVSALISTILAIYMTKDDIMENDYAEKKDHFGIITFENGYEEVFHNDDCKTYLNSSNWQQFFRSSKDRRICIVGVHINGFFERDNYRECLLNLCLENDYTIEIILANPYSEEVLKQAYAENKPSEDYVKNKILATYELFQKDIAKLDEQYNQSLQSGTGIGKPSERLKDKFSIIFSNTLPKALIFRAGEYMIVSPYLFESPSRAPTLIVENSRSFSFYDNYQRYIERLKEQSFEYGDLKKHISADSFFTQPYRNLSPEFYEDINTCESLDILGLGQKHMFTQLEPQIIQIVKRNGKIRAILGNPDGASTEMCVKRSLIHDNVAEAAIEHKLAINRMLKIKHDQNTENVKVYIWDCFFPYTLYIFNREDSKKIKIYIYG